ncbi:MAG TPA: hypothetical protein VJ891_18065 [Casimicrobiaceae bacterium]|nr:hypothetical protein [Casimicrobiaceae bacterium]
MYKTIGLALIAFAASNVAVAVTSGPVTPIVRAYPPSCLSAPLTDLPSGPTYVQPTMLASLARDTLEFSGFEAVDFIFWRVACEGGKSALLLRISRVLNADPSRVVEFPAQYGILARQGAAEGSIRLAQEPNTRDSTLLPGAIIETAITLVVDNVPQASDYPGILAPPALLPGVRGSRFDFNAAIEVTIPNSAADGIDPLPSPIVVSIPAYDASVYPDAGLPMPITGYNAGNYFDAAHAGEGIVVDVGDQSIVADMPPRRYTSVAWFSYDTNGKPFWLFGAATLSPGDRSVEVPLSYFNDGGFAGQFGASSTQSPWGSITLSFPDCTSMHFTYAARAGLAPPVPSGDGERSWTRLTGSNGLACN